LRALFNLHAEHALKGVPIPILYATLRSESATATPRLRACLHSEHLTTAELKAIEEITTAIHHRAEFWIGVVDYQNRRDL
jgi:hypothetical protein